MAKLTQEVRSANELNIKRWIEQRKNGIMQSGSVRCTYADVYIPTLSGSIIRCFSLQKPTIKRFANEAIITDCGINELNQAAMTRIFGVPAPCRDVEFYATNRLHVGVLSDSAFRLMQESGVPIIKPYVLYDPRRFTWYIGKHKITPFPEDPIDSMPNGEEKRRNILLPALLVAAASLIN